MELSLDLVKTYHIPLDLHPHLPDPRFTMDRLPGDAIETSIYDFMTLPSWSDAKVVEKSHHLSLPLLERVLSHTTTLAAKGAIILLPTPNEIAASLSDSRLAKKSKGHSQARVCSNLDTTPKPSRPSKKRKLKKRASEASTSAPELDQAEGVDETELADFCTEIEDNLERDEGVSTRVISVPIPCLGNRLAAPPFIAIVSASEPSYVGTLAHACTSGRSLSLRGAIVSGHAGKSRAEVMLCQLDLLDSLARSALARDPDVVAGKALDQTITPAELRRTKFLLPLELSNRGNVLSALLVSHGYELNSRYTYSETRVASQRYAASKEVKKLESQLTDAKAASVCLSEELTRTDVKLSEQALTVRDLQNELALERLLSSDELHAALARVASLGANVDFDKALVDFPTTPFPFLGKVAAVAGGTLSDVAQSLLLHLVLMKLQTKCLFDHVSDDSAASI
ncbi:hypothetical protein Tco_0907711 [Tanacetum coccineum]|uniref:Uncharacterized protein n=1 Tax=Tanacetum coccineum TaxID=301880 RepID=A0ABQ5CNI3_9ASTR